MRSHYNFIAETNEKRLNKLLIDTVTSYLEIYVFPNMNFLLSYEDAQSIKNILTFGVALTAEEFEDRLSDLLQSNAEADKIKLIYKVLRRLIAEPITEVDTLGAAIASMGVHLPENKISRLNTTLRILIFDAIDSRANALKPQLK